MTWVIMFLVLLETKHFVADGPLQFPWHYLNKGTYGHMGGVCHAALHGIGTAMAAVCFVHPIGACLLGTVDWCVHYHIDWAKMKLNRRWDLRPDNSEKFWWLLMFDQYLHQLTYIAILWAVVAAS